jgi:hypothetical protein
MLLLQTVVVGVLLAQGSLDQRSPFGANAPNMNDGTPAPRMMNPSDSTQPGSAPSSVGDSMSNTKIPPPQSQPDAGPPPPAGGTTAPGVAPAGTGSPGGTLGATPNASTSSQAPSTTGMPARNPTGLEPGTSIPGTSTPAPLPVPAPTQAQPPSPTLPGASSGASNTR